MSSANEQNRSSLFHMQLEFNASLHGISSPKSTLSKRSLQSIPPHVYQAITSQLPHGEIAQRITSHVHYDLPAPHLCQPSQSCSNLNIPTWLSSFKSLPCLYRLPHHSLPLEHIAHSVRISITHTHPKLI